MQVRVHFYSVLKNNSYFQISCLFFVKNSCNWNDSLWLACKAAQLEMCIGFCSPQSSFIIYCEGWGHIVGASLYADISQSSGG